MSAEKPRVSDPIEMGSDGGRPWAEALAEAEYICLSDSLRRPSRRHCG
jgi:hypothetical protein